MSDDLEQNDDKEDINQQEITPSSSNDDEDANFFFLYNLAKKMVLKRHETGDIYTFSSWLKALLQNNNKIIRNKYIKLMILALQHPEPTCPFKEPPPETIDPLENEVFEMSRKFRRNEGTATCAATSEFKESYPSISTAVSNDTCQYASSHVIPNVGVQCYFAFSDEPMYGWTLPSQITVPKKGPHAKDIDWERALAGIRLQSYKPSIDHSESPNTLSNASIKQDNVTLISMTGSNITKKKTPASINGELDLCQVMYIEQLNRNVTEEFGWNDASLLTGEIILGAEPCSDRKVDVQIKTQIAIDEESVKIYEKLYPGDFKIFVEPTFIEDMMPMKKFVAMEADATNESQPNFDNSKLQNSGKAGISNKNVSTLKNHRQCAGGEIIKLQKNRNDNVKKQMSPKSKKLKISSDFFSIKDNFQSNETFENVKSKYAKCTDVSAEEITGVKKQTSEYDFYIEQFNKRKIAFQRNSSDFQRRINTVEENIQRANARNKNSKNTDDMDSGSSDV